MSWTRCTLVWLGGTAPVLAQEAEGAAPAGIRPVIAAADAPARFSAWRTAQSLAPERLACEAVWPEALLCLRIWEDGQRRWVSTDDLARWQVDFPAVREALAVSARDHVARAALVPVEGMDARYLQLVDGDGWAAAGVLEPGLLAERLGGLPVRVAVPAQSVLIAWRPQGPAIDRVMAVGVRELYEQQPMPISPKVVQWDGEKWTPFGEAVPAESVPAESVPAGPAPSPPAP